MLLPLKLICDRCARKDGTNLISIQYRFQADAKTLLNTDIYIPARYWSKKFTRIMKEMPPKYGNAKVLNESLCLQMRIVEDFILFAKKIKIEDEIGFLK